MAAVWLHSALKEASERATRVMAYALEKLGGLPPPAGKSYHDESPRWMCWHTLLALKEADNAVALQGVKALYIKLTTSTDRDDIKQQVLFDCTTAVLTRLAVERGGDYALLAQDAQVVMAEGSEPTWAALLDCFMDKDPIVRPFFGSCIAALFLPVAAFILPMLVVLPVWAYKNKKMKKAAAELEYVRLYIEGTDEAKRFAVMEKNYKKEKQLRSLAAASRASGRDSDPDALRSSAGDRERPRRVCERR